MFYLADLFSVPAIKTWKLLAFSEMEWVKKGQNFFFRAFGGTHIKAFFAVSVEKKIEAFQEIFHDNHKLSNEYLSLFHQNVSAHIDELD
ncbi:MAG: hypothetical protein CMB93_01930 [Flammeovirgaceae bacterium]|jgi:hypothetical protein|nr:hypothetical protein [Flammeovirgaceae bacterium]